MNILLIPGSARPNSAGKQVSKLVSQQLANNEDVNVTIADVAGLNLPFYDNIAPPASDDFSIDNQAVQAWSDQVKSADAVVLIMPEYNHAMSALQKNAIDWLFSEWRDKPAGVVAYGFYGGQHSIDNFQAINDNIKLDVVEPIVQLYLGKDINFDGSPIDESLVTAKVVLATDALVAKLRS